MVVVLSHHVSSIVHQTFTYLTENYVLFMQGVMVLLEVGIDGCPQGELLPSNGRQLADMDEIPIVSSRHVIFDL